MKKNRFPIRSYIAKTCFVIRGKDLTLIFYSAWSYSKYVSQGNYHYVSIGLSLNVLSMNIKNEVFFIKYRNEKQT